MKTAGIRTYMAIASLNLLGCGNGGGAPEQTNPQRDSSAPAVGSGKADGSASTGGAEASRRYIPVDGSGAAAKAAPPPPAPIVLPAGRGDCRTDYAPDAARDPNQMCKVDGGTFTMGANMRDLPDPKVRVYQSETPAHKVTVGPYYIDQFEVTAAQIAFWLNERGNNKCDGKDGKCIFLGPNATSPVSMQEGRFVVAVGAERLPFDIATFEGARAYCEWAKKRLPTEAEWEFAARHDPKTGKDLKFPWGNTLEAKRANCDEDVCKDGFKDLSPVGSFHGENGLLDDSSPWGAHDMSGNASEFVADCWTEHYTPCKGSCENPNRTERNCDTHTLRQSSWSSDADGMRTTLRQPANVSAGLRCARGL